MDIPPSVAALVESAATPFERAHAMPASAYTCPEFLRREIDAIFAREWIMLGRASSLARPGDYVAAEIAGQPVLVMRGRDGALRAMSNVCRHRMSTLLEGKGNAQRIVCPYHAWTYDLDGSLVAAPAMERNACFRREEIALPPLRCEEWLGWIMVTLDTDAPPVAERLAGVHGLIEDYGLERYTETFRETFSWDTNWKILAENFMESYHLPRCHAGTIGRLSRLEEMDCPPGLPAFNYHTILKDDSLRIALAHPSNTRMKGDRRRTTFLLAVYPAMLVTLTPGYFWYLSLHPEGTGRVRVVFGGGMAPEFVEAPEAQADFARVKALLDKVNDEDKACTERVYRGVLAGDARPGPLSHLERPNHDFAQYLAEKLGGFRREFAAG